VKIDNTGRVTLAYCVDTDITTTDMNVKINIFTSGNEPLYFDQKVKFKENAKDDIYRILDEKK